LIQQLQHLQRLTLDHVRVEESEILPLFRDRLSRSQVQEIIQNFPQLKMKAPKRPLPNKARQQRDQPELQQETLTLTQTLQRMRDLLGQ
jgi:hypothetical protein